jgi:hypothetical protein
MKTDWELVTPVLVTISVVLCFWLVRYARRKKTSVSKLKQIIMNKETMFRVSVVGLLAATLVVQTLILCRLPPKATPIGVYVENPSLDVDVGNTVDVNVQEVLDTPLEVTIVR